ncbi:MAG: hypothetical protein V2I43_09730 [Parvularcula sp.]|jgi:hypothetical protein|nr:hypothetical protein [Parvularcula sp.]
MPARFETPERYIDQGKANREGLRAPRDGAVFHTSGAGAGGAAERYVERRTRSGHPSVCLETTPLGGQAHSDRLYEDAAFNELQRRRQVTGYVGSYAGAQRTFDGLSKIYAEETRGRVTVLHAGRSIHPDSTFARVEFDVLMKNPHVTEMNGIKGVELQRMRDDWAKAGRDGAAKEDRQRVMKDFVTKSRERTLENKPQITAESPRKNSSSWTGKTPARDSIKEKGKMK